MPTTLITRAKPARSERVVALPSGLRIRLRPLEPADEALYPEALEHISAEDRRLRFFSQAVPSARQVFELTHYDASSVVAIAAIGLEDGRLYGVSRLHRVSDRTGEFAVVVRSDLKGQGLGRALLQAIIEAAPGIGIDHLVGLVLRENVGMLALASELGFTRTSDPTDPSIVRASLSLVGSPFEQDGEGRLAA